MNERFSDDQAAHDRPVSDAPSTNGRSQDASILLIDDNPDIARAIGIALRIAGYRFDTASGPEEAWSRLAQRRYAAILLDLNFRAGAVDGEEGLACLRRIVADDPAACVIVITAHSGIRIAVAAMQAGARDFLMKPWRNADLIAKMEAAMKQRPVAAAAPAHAAGAEPPLVLIGESAAMHALRALIRRVAPIPAGIAVTGPPGSGRTLVARAIHAASPAAGAPVTRIDLRRDDRWDRVAAADGAAGGAVILRYADRLDRIEQEMLLDHLSAAIPCITVGETIAPLIPALRRRLATIEVAVPPLAARGEDAVLLARHFARIAADRFGKPGARLTQAAEAVVRSTAWADEVRGLALAVERAVVLADDGVIDAALLEPTPSVPVPVVAGEASFGLTDAERALIEAALREHRHNVTHAAVALGLSRGALYRRMARYGL
ncbi:MAG: sigma-54-dependent Fis family transcriptional regulator [Sphingomonas sp.]|nr:MAG: sigma-54-dependent Fis family transcriptional regulator [Sphingomonas sp.]